MWSNVFMLAGLRREETLLVHGGSSGIGTMAIQLAHRLGARVAVTAGSARMYLRNSCAQLLQSNSAVHSGTGLPRTRRNMSPVSKGWLTIVATPREAATGNSLVSASRVASE